MKRRLVERNHAQLSLRRQCQLLDLNRSSYYYQAAPESELNLALMRAIDEQYMKTPFYGYPKMTAYLCRQRGYLVNPKRIYRLMRLMGLQAVGPKPNTSQPSKEHKIYPYLLRGLKIERVDQVWSTDITYIPMGQGFMYLVAVMDWYSRFVLSWEISNTLDGTFCLKALDNALIDAKPEIFNTDQGAQFTAHDFTQRLEKASVKISMDGRGRVFDNIFIERLWRSVKHEHIYLNDYENGLDLAAGLATYFDLYNFERPHQSLNYSTPAQVYGLQHPVALSSTDDSA